MQLQCASSHRPAPSLQRRNAAFVAAGPRRATTHRAAASMPTATDLPTVSELPSRMDAMNAVRKSLRGLGWDDAWIDGVVGEVRKGRLVASVSQIEAVVGFLTSQCGVPTKSVENMASVASDMLASSLEQVQAVVEYARRQGVDGGALVRLLEEHPKLLTYSVAGDVLEKGQARASVDVTERNGRKVAGVSYWRQGAAFESAPVAPYRPKAL